MDPFEESGLRFLPPTEACFRFSGFRSYQRLSGRQLSEMDVGYWDEGRRSIILIELKDYATREPSRELIPKLVAKGRDCLLILHAAWSELSDAARAIASELPEVCRQRQRVRMFFVLKVGPGGLAREALNPMRDKLESEIKVYAELLGLEPLLVLLLDHDKAIEKGLPLALVEG